MKDQAFGPSRDVLALGLAPLAVLILTVLVFALALRKLLKKALRKLLKTWRLAPAATSCLSVSRRSLSWYSRHARCPAPYHSA